MIPPFKGALYVGTDEAFILVIIPGDLVAMGSSQMIIVRITEETSF